MTLPRFVWMLSECGHVSALPPGTSSGDALPTGPVYELVLRTQPSVKLLYNHKPSSNVNETASNLAGHTVNGDACLVFSPTPSTFASPALLLDSLLRPGGAAKQHQKQIQKPSRLRHSTSACASPNQQLDTRTPRRASLDLLMSRENPSPGARIHSPQEEQQPQQHEGHASSAMQLRATVSGGSSPAGGRQHRHRWLAASTCPQERHQAMRAILGSRNATTSAAAAGITGGDAAAPALVAAAAARCSGSHGCATSAELGRAVSEERLGADARLIVAVTAVVPMAMDSAPVTPFARWTRRPSDDAQEQGPPCKSARSSGEFHAQCRGGLVGTDPWVTAAAAGEHVSSPAQPDATTMLRPSAQEGPLDAGIMRLPRGSADGLPAWVATTQQCAPQSPRGPPGLSEAVGAPTYMELGGFEREEGLSAARLYENFNVGAVARLLVCNTDDCGGCTTGTTSIGSKTAVQADIGASVDGAAEEQGRSGHSACGNWMEEEAGRVGLEPVTSAEGMDTGSEAAHGSAGSGAAAEVAWADLASDAVACIAMKLPQQASQATAMAAVCRGWRAAMLGHSPLLRRIAYSLDLSNPLRTSRRAPSPPAAPSSQIASPASPAPGPATSAPGAQSPTHLRKPPSQGGGGAAATAATSALWFRPGSHEVQVPRVDEAELLAAAMARQHAMGAFLLSSHGPRQHDPRVPELCGGTEAAAGALASTPSAMAAAAATTALAAPPAEVISELRSAVRSSLPRLLLAAAAGGNPSAQLVLAQVLEASDEARGALRWWRKLTQAGDVMAMFKLGMALYDGSHGLQPDAEAAHLWLGRTVRKVLHVDSLSAICLDGHQGSGRAAAAQPPPAASASAAVAAAASSEWEVGHLMNAAQRQGQGRTHGGRVGPALQATVAALDAPWLHMLAWSSIVLGYLEFDGVAGRSVWGMGDRSEAVRLFRLAEACGLAEASAVLGWMYNTGQF